MAASTTTLGSRASLHPYDPNDRSINADDPDLANKLFERFGYKAGTDGRRTMPDVAPLLPHIATETSATLCISR